MITELDYGLGSHFKGSFVAKNSNMTPEWRKRVWIYYLQEMVYHNRLWRWLLPFKIPVSTHQIDHGKPFLPLYCAVMLEMV